MGLVGLHVANARRGEKIMYSTFYLVQLVMFTVGSGFSLPA